MSRKLLNLGVNSGHFTVSIIYMQGGRNFSSASLQCPPAYTSSVLKSLLQEVPITDRGREMTCQIALTIQVCHNNMAKLNFSWSRQLNEPQLFKIVQTMPTCQENTCAAKNPTIYITDLGSWPISHFAVRSIEQMTSSTNMFAKKRYLLFSARIDNLGIRMKCQKISRSTFVFSLLSLSY